MEKGCIKGKRSVKKSERMRNPFIKTKEVGGKYPIGPGAKLPQLNSGLDG